MTISTERLKEIIERRSPSRRWGEAEEIAAELLAIREAQPVIGDCDPEVYENGKSVCLVDVPKHTAENICRSISEATGFRIDWHYVGGRVHIKALSPPAAATISPTTPGEVLDRAILGVSIAWPLSAEQIKRLYTDLQREIERQTSAPLTSQDFTKAIHEAVSSKKVRSLCSICGGGGCSRCQDRGYFWVNSQ